MTFKRVGRALGLIFLALVVVGCYTGTPRTRKALPEWSRGEQLGVTSLNQPVSMTAADDSLHLVWVAVESQALRYVRLDRSGQIQVSTDVDIDGAHPSASRVVVGTDGSPRILWTDNPRIPRTLFLARLNGDGRMVAEPQPLSAQGVRVSDYDVAQNADDSLDVFWATEVPTEGGVYHLGLSRGDQVVRANRLLLSNAAKPTLQVAGDGMIHLAWIEGPSLQENDVYYGVFDPRTGELASRTRVGFYRTGTGLVSYGPVLGLDSTTAYVFWALEARGGGQAGEAQTFSISFPLSAPAFNEALTVDIAGTARPEYQAMTGTLPYRRLAAADAAGPTGYLYMPATLGGQRDELGVFLAGQISTRSRSSVEVMWVILADGKVKGYQLPTERVGTMRPTGVLDGLGNAHMTWLNAAGFGRYEVYYASTSEAVRAHLDHVTLQDWAMDFLNAVWYLAPALGFFPPVFLLWSIASFVWVIGFYLVKVEGGLERRSARTALVVAIVLYLLSKFFLMPAVLLYAPFTDRLPANLQFIPVLGTLAFTTLAALGAVALYSRRAETRSLFAAYVIFVLADSLLSLIIYVPGWIGT